jgi:hypothetical protein
MTFSRRASGLDSVLDINWNPKWIRLWHHLLERPCQPLLLSLSQKSRKFLLDQKQPRSSRRHYQERIQIVTETDGVATEVEAGSEHRLADPEVGVGIVLGEIVGTEIGTPADETAETVMTDDDATIAETVADEIVVHALATGDEATDHAVAVAIVGREIGEFEPTVLGSAEKKPKLSNWKASEPASKNLENGLQQGKKPKTRVSQCHYSTSGRLNGIGRWRRRVVLLLFLRRPEADETTTEMLLLPDHEIPETEIGTAIERDLHDLVEADRALLQ